MFTIFYNNIEDSDIRVKVGDDMIYCHKIILKSKSEMLRAGLSHTMREVSDDIFIFPEHNPLAVMLTIKWMYGLKFNARELDATEFYDLIAFTHYLQVNDLYEYIIYGDYPEDIDLGDLMNLAYIYSSNELMHRVQLLCVSLPLEKVIESLKKVRPDAYTLFRSDWETSHMENEYLLFYLDCHYVQLMKENKSGTIKDLSKYIAMVRFDNFTPMQLKQALHFPIIQHSLIMRNMLQCILNLREKIVNSRK